MQPFNQQQQHQSLLPKQVGVGKMQPFNRKTTAGQNQKIHPYYACALHSTVLSKPNQTKPNQIAHLWQTSDLPAYC
jgi:hypothetical protein